MTKKSEWQDVNRALQAEDRRALGDPPTAEEMLAYSRGELSELEEERIRDLLVAYPELARVYGTPFPEELRVGGPDAVPEEEIAAGWNDLQQRLVNSGAISRRAPGAVLPFRRYYMAGIAALFALVFCGLYIQTERRAQGALPFVLGEPQELEPGSTRGGSTPASLRRDGDAYLLQPRLINQVRYAHYRIELHDASDDKIWETASAEPDENDVFEIVIPHAFLRAGETYRLVIYGVNGDTATQLGVYPMAVPAE